MSETQRQKELEGKGWTRRTVADEPRLGEAAELYRSLGFEILLEPLEPHTDPHACTSCLYADPERYRVIYTRPSDAAQDTLDDDLFE